jgi:thermitase
VVPRFSAVGVAAASLLLILFAVPALAAEGPRDGAPDRLIVAFDRGADGSDRSQALRDVEATAAKPLPALGQTDAVTVADGTAASAVAELNGANGVAWAEVDRPVHATMALPAGTQRIWQWGLSNTGQTLWDAGVAGVDGNFTAAWDLSTGSAQAPIAVVDTGVDFANGDLAANRVAGGHDFVANDDDPAPGPPNAQHPDATSHGTHVAGIAAASLAVTNRSDITGGAPSAGIMALRALDTTGSGSMSTIASAFAWAGDHGARVVNASLSGTGPSQALATAITTHPNTLYVVAAGNSTAGINEDAKPESQRDYPCALDLANVVCVAAVDSQGALASFSNYGKTLVDVGAPGVDIVSYVLGGNLDWWSGTSMATPFVAAAAELAIVRTPTVTAQQLRDAIIATARPLSALNGRSVSGGMVDAGALVARVAGLPVVAAPTAAARPAPTATTTTQPVTTPADPVTAPPLESAPSQQPALRSPQLKLAHVKRSGKRLRVTGTLARAWRGTVTVTACVGRHCTRTRTRVTGGRFSAKLAIARGHRVKVTVAAPAAHGYRAVRATRSA